MKSFRLLIACTHPVQYAAPWFRHLAAVEGIEIMVWYAMIPDSCQQGTGFGKDFTWDLPLLHGYPWECLENTARHPGLDGFFGTRLQGIQVALEKLSPDAVLVTGWHQWSLVQVALTARRKGIPLMVRGESNDIAVRPIWKRYLQRWFLGLFHSYLYIGKANQEFYLSRRVPSTALFSCPYFVDNQRFQQDAAETHGASESLRAGWGAAEKDTVFVFVGKFQPKKCPHQLLQAFVDSRSRGGGMILVFVGDGEMRESLECEANLAGLPIHFPGFVNQHEIGRYYQAADCLVLPSDCGETWGLVVNEAMNFGLPVIVSDQVGCARDLVYGKGTGYVFPQGDQAALSLKLEEMHRNEKARQIMGERARKLVAHYSMETATKGLLQALDTLGESGSLRV